MTDLATLTLLFCPGFRAVDDFVTTKLAYVDFTTWMDIIGLPFSSPPDVNTFIHLCAAVRYGGYPVFHTLLAEVRIKISIIMASKRDNDTAGIEKMSKNVRFSTKKF